MSRWTPTCTAVIAATLLIVAPALAAQDTVDPTELPTQRSIATVNWFVSDLEFMYGAELTEPTGSGWELGVFQRGQVRNAVLYQDGRAIGSELTWLRNGRPSRLARFDADGQQISEIALWYDADGSLRGMLASGEANRQLVFTATEGNASVLTHDAEDVIIERYRDDARPSYLERRTAGSVVEQRWYDYDSAGVLLQERTVRQDPNVETIQTFSGGLLVALQEISDGRTTRRETREYDAEDRVTLILTTTRGGQQRDVYRYEDEAQIVERFIDGRLVQRTNDRGAVRVVENFIDGQLVATARYRNGELVESSGRVE